MTVFAVTAVVDTITIKADYGEDWKGSCDIPEFRIDAASEEEAREMAENIVDPLHMTGVHLTVTEVARLPLAERLRKALRG